MTQSVRPFKSTTRRIFRRFGGMPGRQTRGLAQAEIFVLSFLALIVVGAVILRFVPGLYVNQGLNWTDSIFTSTSAVCVTGLIVVDTASYFTPMGQAVILSLIQLGGLGMLVLTSVIISALGGRPSLSTENLAVGARHMLPQIAAKRLIVDVVRFTFFLEAMGALALYAIWAPQLGWSEAIWPAIFHSVSAFCNAGFSTYSSSLMGFQNSPATIVVISLLVIAGGLGFISMEELHQRYILRNKAVRRLSIHTKLVLVTSGLLLFGCWPIFAAFEWRGVLSEMSTVDKLTNSWFLSVTPRTAGFNTIDYAAASDSTNFLTIILMMIGGSPGSTAGGMKTTTFALLGLLAWSRLRSHSTASFADRSIPAETIQRATGLFVIVIGAVVLGMFLLTSIGDAYDATEPFIAVFFEVASAFNTVGLSMGVTPELSAPSRWVVIVLMFVGRTGPLSIAAALVVRLTLGGRYRLAYEDVVVG